MARLHEYMDNDLPELPPDSTYRQWTSERALFYARASDLRAEAMERYLWHEEEGMWKDHWLGSRPEGMPEVLSASNFIPLWGGLANHNGMTNEKTKERVHKIVQRLQDSELLQVGR